mmetsp:Transcript_3499/g.6801  ORF Transcript_3499/g.6801 Transcript_3499/m.6801 type:complete len:132 (-) Transcript_3499:301-696(-)
MTNSLRWIEVCQIGDRFASPLFLPVHRSCCLFMSISPFALKLLRSCGDVSCQGAVPRRKQKSQGAPRTAAVKERGKPQRMQTKSRRLRAEGKACNPGNRQGTVEEGTLRVGDKAGAIRLDANGRLQSKERG